jgi:branched-chain amino acid transport system ATP-binding protein
MSDGALLRAKGLYKSFGALQATVNVDLDLHHGEIHALIGPNGAGKTTVLAQLSGQLAPDKGTILYDGQDITSTSMPRRARSGIARSFQITAIFESFTVRRNVALAVQACRKHHFSFLRDTRRDRRLIEPAMAFLERVGLADQADAVAASLSHGQKRQLEIAMALAIRPRVFLLDEPMAGMGPSESAAMTGLIRELREDHAILLVEHDMDVVFALADRITVLVYGAIIASGAPEAIRADPEVQRAYLNEDPNEEVDAAGA